MQNNYNYILILSYLISLFIIYVYPQVKIQFLNLSQHLSLTRCFLTSEENI